MNRDLLHPTSATIYQYVKTMIPLHIPKTQTEKWILAMCKDRIESKLIEKLDQELTETKQQMAHENINPIFTTARPSRRRSCTKPKYIHELAEIISSP